jgi:hypothetical protein
MELSLLSVRLLRMRLDYGAARLVGLALQLGSTFFLLGILCRFLREPVCRAALTPLTVCLAFMTDGWDLLAYNAEQPLIFLLCAAAYGCARLATAGPTDDPVRWALVTGLALGLVPWGKLQAVPIALVLGGLALVCLVKRARELGRRWRAAGLALLAGGLAPAVAVGVYLATQDLFPHFWTTYVDEPECH